MDHATRDDRNPFFPSERQSTLGLTLGMFGTAAIATIVAISLFVAQLDALASTPDVTVAHAPFADPMAMDDADECQTHHALRFAPLAPIDAPVTDVELIAAELIVTCDGEEPHAVLSADCVTDPIGCLIVLASGDGAAPVRDVPSEAFGKPMHPDPLPYGGADPHTLSMIERAASDTLSEGSI